MCRVLYPQRIALIFSACKCYNFRMQFPAHSLARYIKYFLGLFEVLLALRVVLKFLAANPAAVIVDLVYKVSDIIIYPFSGIFRNAYLAGGGIVDVVAISAIIGYPILAYIISEIIYMAAKE